MQRTQRIGCLIALAGLGSAAAAQNITITVENLLDPGNFSATPFWLALSNGDFDIYDNGVAASTFPFLEPLAEQGMTDPISDAFTASGAGAAGGVQTTLASTVGAPVFSPGESESVVLAAGDPTVNRWLSFASMIVPSNDLYLANADPFAHEVFDAAGNFLGPFEIILFGRDANDAGTEVNNAFGGAAFSANGGDGVDENGLIRDFFTQAGDQDYLDSFIGTDTADGNTILASFGPDDAFIRIRVTPAPASLGLLGLAGIVGVRRRR